MKRSPGKQAIRIELATLYSMLEQGVMSEADFDERERLLLDRLDLIEDHAGTMDRRRQGS